MVKDFSFSLEEARRRVLEQLKSVELKFLNLQSSHIKVKQGL